MSGSFGIGDYAVGNFGIGDTNGSWVVPSNLPQGGDIRIVWDALNGRGDFNMVGPILEVGHDLETAVLISLFTEGRAPVDFTPTDGTTDLRGWWGDTYNADNIGSLLWTFARAKKTQGTLNNIQDAARKALQWLIDDGVAATIDIAAAWVSKTGLGLGITIHKPGALPSQFSFVWDAP